MKGQLLIICFFFFLNQINASHILGGEISYQCMGNGLYKIRYNYYYDCTTQQPLPDIRCYFRSNCGLSVSRDLPLLNSSFEQIVPSCSQLTTCDGGLSPGIQKWIYEDTITIPDTCPNISLEIILNSRIAGVTTITHSDNYTFFLQGIMNNTDTIIDSSPAFTNNPIIFTCVNQPFCLDPGLFDADGDSMICSLMNPRSSINDPIPYDSGYSASQFILSNPPVNFDSRTGTICLTPTQPAVTIYSIQVDSYRNNIFIGRVVRDLVLYVINCPGSQPDISGINGSGTFDTTICANLLTCFDITSVDPDSSDSTSIIWDHGIPDAMFFATSSKNESGQFCWTPHYNDISSIPHCFTFRVQDNSCPVQQTNLRTFCITVVDSADCANLSTDNYLFAEGKIKVYPQPATDFITFDCGTLFDNKNLKLCINDFLGRKINEVIISEKITQIYGLLPGIYFCYLIDEKGVILKIGKIIII